MSNVVVGDFSVGLVSYVNSMHEDGMSNFLTVTGDVIHVVSVLLPNDSPVEEKLDLSTVFKRSFSMTLTSMFSVFEEYNMDINGDTLDLRIEGVRFV